MVKAGVSDEEAQVYAEGIRRGGTLVSVRADDRRAIDAERIMDQRGNANWKDRSACPNIAPAAGLPLRRGGGPVHVPPSVMADEDLNRR